MPKTDVIIIGAGPSGLFAAFYVGMRDLTARIIDPMAEVGGQLSALYPDKFIYDIAGFPKIRAKELVRNLVEQVKPFDPIYTLEERAERLEPLDEDGFAVTTSSGRTYLSRAVIITAGVGRSNRGASRPKGWRGSSTRGWSTPCATPALTRASACSSSAEATPPWIGR